MTDRRAANLARLRNEDEEFDVLILGGGINGAGIARDLTLRGAGLRVGLVEKNHFASGTSGRNSQLIHGGLRYLRYFEFHLVQEALRERATLLQIAPGLVHPLRFLLPCYHPTDRWFYGAGLALYDQLGADRPLGPHRALTREETRALEPHLASEHLHGGLVFSDGRVNSARLVLENLLDAEARGAAIANYVEAHTDGERVEAQDTLSGGRFTIRARKIVDATGAWSSGGPLRLVRGSHLIFPRVQQGAEAVAYFDDAGRIVFLIPWGENDDLTLVGTTDIDHTEGPDRVRISRPEADYLTAIVRRLFPAYTGDPVSSYSALRPLIAEEGKSATSTSREHRIRETSDGVIHIAGGKYTTYRAMSEELVDMLLRELKPAQMFPCRTGDTRLKIPPVPADSAARIRVAVEREYARHLTDVLHVSTYWGYERFVTREFAEPVAREMGALLRWDESTIENEVAAAIRLTAIPE